MKELDITQPWDLYWSDLSISIERAKDMKKFQKTNHFPGMTEICRKDLLARNLNRMIKIFPNDYNFFPKTWYLPIDFTKLQDHMSQHKGLTYILKPDVGCQGIGIYLTKSTKNIARYEKLICQHYVSKPLLIDGYKFDMRVYTLIASCDPLRIYVYNDGLVRLATEPYEKPTSKNLKNLFMHLTNYSVNKRNTMYIDNEMYGSKRRLKTLNSWLEARQYSVEKIWEKIDDVIIKTVIVAYPFVNRSYQTCFPNHEYTSACFEILGFDILLDVNCKPHLLEVNHSPSFHTDTKLDQIVKEELLRDTFKLLQLDTSIKKLVSEEEKWKAEQRILNTDKNLKYKRTNNETAEKNSTSKDVGEPIRKCSCCSNSSKEPLIKKEKSIFKPLHVLRNAVSMIDSRSNTNKTIVMDTDIVMTMTEKRKSICHQNYATKNYVESNIKSTHSEAKELVMATRSNFNVKNSKVYIFNKPLAKKDSAQMQTSIIETNPSLENEKIFKIKIKKQFADVQSSISSIRYKKRKGYWNCWKDVEINIVDENERLAGLKDRDKIMFNMGIKEIIYNAFEKFNNLTEKDIENYTNYEKKKKLVGPPSQGCSVWTIMFMTDELKN
ncbi:tubulin polyglutamylase TTLL6-like [Adelges cooleyi]|uniref:tubulin polyglutamylase TTLL6-like n=1 Tax=Adelges cooleyi TaxID=133065 RepID=UPI0021807020|nr:tubulin polyglutamylase TTLL6-like [Adelges cooleyi]